MSTASQNVLPLSLPGSTSHRPSNGLNIAQGRPSLKKRKNLRTQGYGNAMTINALTDNALVEIFDFCRMDHIQYSSRPVWKWHLLAHVWDSCQEESGYLASHSYREYGLRDDWYTTIHDDEDNIVAALEHGQQGAFPVLTCLSVSSSDAYVNVPVIPSGFLTSAPCLREIEFTGVPFPALPVLRLLASGLVELRLRNIPQTSYISPEVMVAHLAVFPKLQTLHIGFLSPDSLPDRIILPPATRTVLPALNHFSCACDYVDNFVARIDAPQLRSIEIYYFDHHLDLQASHQALLDLEFKQLSEFINRSESLKRTLSGHCQIIVDNIEDAVECCIGGTIGDKVERQELKTGIFVYLQCDWMKHIILHLAHVLSRIAPVLSDIIHFAINPERSKPSSRSSLADLNFFEWLHLIRPFSSVQTLFVAAIFAGHVSSVLRDTAGLTISEVLPALELLCLEDSVVR
ncbi:hypothetical protein EDB89DRAFT_2072470 [Lactarius sanguifluus]|nr:hypothetical protein EDB89DRAFT_2072470 [Lactarius sanguifluus]